MKPDFQLGYATFFVYADDNGIAGLKGGNQRVQVGNTIVIIGGDVVIKADHREIKTNDELIHYIREKKPGDTIVLGVYKKGGVAEVKVRLQERPRRER